MRLKTSIAALAVMTMVAVGCSDDSSSTSPDGSTIRTNSDEIVLPARIAEGVDAPTAEQFGLQKDPATGLRLRPGVETLTVTGAQPKADITLLNAEGDDLLTLTADTDGQANFAYVPDETMRLDSTTGRIPTTEGSSLAPGTYSVRVDGEQSRSVRVLGVAEVPDHSFYERQRVGDGFGYVTMRDGVKLSVMVRLPGPPEDGPYPTVVEYSGYGPSDPDSPQPGSQIAAFLGFATVGVNMRGTGCSGGVFDVFNPAQQADGYDMIEAIAAQDWVKGNKVGMVGLSYAGISQLYVASTQPPSLAAITPLSTIDDPWREQYPGGLYNDGFTKQWLAERTNQAGRGGQEWDGRLIAAGDRVCERNERIRTQNLDFESFGKALSDYPLGSNSRFLQLLVPRINVPVYQSGAYQDEQTGGRFPYLMTKYDNAPIVRFKLFNGHHPDGYSPMVVNDWYEFLSFYVSREIPDVPEGIREASPGVFDENFGTGDAGFTTSRFAEYLPDDFAGALDAYEAEAPVQVLVESGAGDNPPGTTGERARWDMTSFPSSTASSSEWYFSDDGALVEDAPEERAADRFAFEPGAGKIVTTDAGSGDFQFSQRDLPIDYTQAPQGKQVSYMTPRLADDLVISGPGYLDLWVRPGANDGAVQVELTEVRPDGEETFVQAGWHELQHAVEAANLSDEFQVEYTFTAADRETLDPNEWIERRVPIPAVTHIFRKGSRLRVSVASPGRVRPLWSFENPNVPAGTKVGIGRGGDIATKLVMPTIDDVAIPKGRPECNTLRGQPCRTFERLENDPAEP